MVRTLLLLLGFAWLAVAPASAEDAPRATEERADYTQLVNEAIAAQQAGEFERARTLFAEAHALEPNARTLRGMGVAAFQAGNFQQAVIDLSAALDHPTKPLEGELRTAVLALLAEAQAKLPADATGSFAVEAPLVAPASPATATHAVAPPVPAEVSTPPSAANPRQSVDTTTNGRALRQATRATLVIGSLMLAGAGALWITGTVRANDIERACTRDCTNEFLDREIERADLHRLELGFNLLAGSAAVALGTSFGVWLWARRAKKHDAQVGFGPRSVSYTAHF